MTYSPLGESRALRPGEGFEAILAILCEFALTVIADRLGPMARWDPLPAASSLGFDPSREGNKRLVENEDKQPVAISLSSMTANSSGGITALSVVHQLNAMKIPQRRVKKPGGH